MYDVAIVGAGMAGMATAARLRARGLSTLVLEAHSLPGGCAGFYRRRGFSFDVGATTLVDFEPDGIGGQFLREIGIDSFDAEHLPGYVAWLPDRRVTLHRDPAAWSRERLAALGDGPRHRAFWETLDALSAVFWRAARRGARLPIRGPLDALRAARAVGPAGLRLARYLNWTAGDLLRARGLRDDRPLAALLSMLVEDTVHSTLDRAPLINAALGVTIRGAGLTRARGGMRGFWTALAGRYRSAGGELRTGCPVRRIERSGGRAGGFLLEAGGRRFEAAQVVGAVPPVLTCRIAPPEVGEWLGPFVRRDAGAAGGAIVVCLGVPGEQVAGQPFTHHQLLQDYARPLGDGNNMFVSVSSPGDTASAPAGFRTVMISTHCELAAWEGLTPEGYARQKREAGERLIALARRVYPGLGERAVVTEVATPQTYERFTGRPRGAVGGARQAMDNANQRAVPHESPLPGFWLAGDGTWPGLGTVACLLGSGIVADGVCARARRLRLRGALSRRITGRPPGAPTPETPATAAPSFSVRSR